MRVGDGDGNNDDHDDDDHGHDGNNDDDHDESLDDSDEDDDDVDSHDDTISSSFRNFIQAGQDLWAVLHDTKISTTDIYGDDRRTMNGRGDALLVGNMGEAKVQTGMMIVVVMMMKDVICDDGSCDDGSCYKSVQL